MKLKTIIRGYPKLTFLLYSTSNIPLPQFSDQDICKVSPKTLFPGYTVYSILKNNNNNKKVRWGDRAHES